MESAKGVGVFLTEGLWHAYPCYHGWKVAQLQLRCVDACGAIPQSSVHEDLDLKENNVNYQRITVREARGR
jgi:hypothetical protein